MRKAVFTYWNPKSDAAGYRNLDELAATLALSLEYAKKHFNIVELCTDQEGYELLVKKYNLQFDMNVIRLNKLNKTLSPDLWAMAKIYSCSLQNGPFVHIDNDFILWQKLPDTIANAPLYFQSQDFPHRAAQYDKMIEIEGKNTPAVILKNHSTTSWNFGIMGFNDISLIKEWKQAADQYLSKIAGDVNPLRQTAMVNMFMEQYFLACLINRNKLKVETLAADLDKISNPETAFTHLWGDCKKNPDYIERVKSRLLKEFPKQYNHIFKTDKIPV
jgi:hypothetical protein